MSSIQDKASALIEKYSKGSFNNNINEPRPKQSVSAGASGLASRINKAIIKTKSTQKLTMKQMKSVEKLTQGLSTSAYKHNKNSSRGNINTKIMELDFSSTPKEKTGDSFRSKRNNGGDSLDEGPVLTKS